ncbi:MAG TPA: hypothetical protein VJO15_03405, partial [Dehalococcoidia bacterium]|nr:hypothetical protein [Dehalococcoidia bacterium]
MLIVVGLAILFGNIAYYPWLLEHWPFGHLGLIKWLEIPIEVFGGFLVLAGLFVGRHWRRMKAIRIFLILLALFTGTTYAYHSLDESGKIDQWQKRVFGERPAPVAIIPTSTPGPTPIPPSG